MNQPLLGLPTAMSLYWTFGQVEPCVRRQRESLGIVLSGSPRAHPEAKPRMGKQ